MKNFLVEHRSFHAAWIAAVIHGLYLTILDVTTGAFEIPVDITDKRGRKYDAETDSWK